MEGREWREGGKGQRICCVTSLIGMLNSNPMGLRLFFIVS